MSHLIRFLVFLAIAALVAGCKVAVIVVEGGEVQSIGSGTCFEGEICMVQVNDTNFSESFTAVPNPGWHFVKWNSGEGFFCVDSTDPACALSTEGTAGNAGIEAIIASDKTFYIMPIFRPGLATLTVDGREWAQVDQFTNLSWNDISAVCPAGVCSGVLNGYDMTSWTWASGDDINALFNHYIGSDEMGPPPSASMDCAGVRDFFSDGWRITYTWWDSLGMVAQGLARAVAGAEGTVVASAVDVREPTACVFLVEAYSGAASSAVGGWFWRPL